MILKSPLVLIAIYRSSQVHRYISRERGQEVSAQLWSARKTSMGNELVLREALFLSGKPPPVLLSTTHLKVLLHR